MNDTVTPTPSPAPSGRYSLADDGQIFLQADPSNPLPGNAVGKLTKGDALLSPKTDYEPAQDWLSIYVRAALEPLFMLKQEAGEGALPEGPTRDIAARLYDHLGVMQRSDLEDLIAKLDPELRKSLRAKGVRFGPILVFLPALVKPAAVKMRAILWGLWNDKTLPVVRPADGRVSEVVDPEKVDRDFYRMIGYPVFARRAIRIDMLDRVVTDFYDNAQSGVFEAKHKYAEWLGTNLDDLYAVLESMGHKRMKDEAPRPGEEPIPNTPTETPKPDSEPAHPPAGPDETPPPAPEPARPEPGPAETPAPSGNPEVPLAVANMVATAKAPGNVVKFMLKRGKMSDSAKPKQERKHRSKPKKKFDPNTPQLLTDEDKARIEARKKEREEARASKPQRSEKPRRDKKDFEERDTRAKSKGDRPGRTPNNEGRVYTFEAAKKDGDDDGNPFAILKNLKK